MEYCDPKQVYLEGCNILNLNDSIVENTIIEGINGRLLFPELCVELLASTQRHPCDNGTQRLLLVPMYGQKFSWENG